jgi:hypothetical protein
MPRTVTLDEPAGIVRAVVSGRAADEEHRAARLEAARLLTETRSRRLLVDLRDLETESIVSTSSCFGFGDSYTRDEGIPLGVSVAHILPRSPTARRDVEFTTAVAQNRGAAIRNFEDPGEAESWLRGA